MPQQQCSDRVLPFSSQKQNNPIVLTVHVNKAVLPMELDTGASLSIISEDTYKSICSVTDHLKPTCTYTGDTLAVLGYIDVQVEYESQVLILSLIVVKGQGTSLFR